MEDLSTQIKILLNKLSDYESLKKQDTEHRKLIRELQKENRELKQQVKNNGVSGDVIISTQCAFCTTITDFENTKIETCDSCKDRGY